MVLVYSLFNETNFPTTELSGTQFQVSPFSSVPFRLRLSGRHKLAIVPRIPSLKPVADQFIADMTALHPALNFTAFGTNLGQDLDGLYIPGFSDELRTFASEADLDAFVSNPDYDRNWESGSDDKIWGAIVFNSEGPNYDYKIRMNNSMVPNPRQPKVDILQRGYSEGAIRSYLYAKMPLTGPPFLVEKGTEITRLEYPGYMSLQLMVDRWIMNSSIPMTSLDADKILLAADATIAMCLVPGGKRWAGKGPAGPIMGPMSLAMNTLLLNNRTSTWNAIRNATMAWLKDMSYKPQQVSLTPFPYFGYNENAFYGTALSILSFFLVIAYVFPVSRLIRGLVLEKEMKLREGMKMMGLGDAALFGSWFAFYGIFWAVLSIIITLISSRTLFKFSFQNGGGGTIWFIFFIFGLSCTTFSYLISVFFTQSKTASSIGIVVFIASFFPVFSVSDGSIDTGVKLASSLLCPTAFGLSLNAAGLLEQNGAGVTRDTSTAILNNFSVNNGIGMMILDTFLYAILAWYADAVLPVSMREYGVPRPWFFPFTAAYWREVFGLSALPDNRLSTSVSNILTATGPDASYIEAPDAELIAKEKAGRFVSINRLRKEFETPDGIKVAVNNIDMTMYEGQIYVLLGHNGAGKTTTISMLTGLITPTSGTMNIFGRDVSTQLGEVRKDLGVCPQHNVLWPELTVREHLQIFSEIKGVPAENRNAEILKAVADVGLTEKIDVLSSNLSGGQKRKLSVCIALVGGSRVIFLDEPTSGMDPYSRRSTWQILQNAREGRVMVLTTHFMDEADILGDRICIMADGGVKCCGSSSFLKERFGVGYILTLIKGSNASVHDIVSLIRNHVPEVNVATNVGAELNLRLPLTSSNVFPVMLAELDSKLQSLGVISYGVSITSIEDVFLKISGGEHFSNEDENTEKASKTKSISDSVAINTTESREATTPQSAEPTMKSVLAAMRKEQSGLSTFIRHTGALLTKRWNYSRRDWKGLLYQIFLPAILIALGLGLIQSGVSLITVDYQLSTAQFNTKKFGDQNVPNFDLVTPNYRFKPVNGSANVDISSIGNLFSSGILKTNTSLNVLSYTASSALSIPDSYGFLAKQPQSVAGEPIFSMRRMSTALLDDSKIVPYSKYGAYMFLKDGSIVSNQGNDDIQNTATYAIMFNSTGRHTGPVFMNLMNSALWTLKNSVGSISARSHPLPLTARQKSLFAGLLVFSAAIIFVLAFAFVAASTALFIVKEKEVSAKHQQLISGVGIFAYWTSNYIFDLSLYFVSAILAIILSYAFKIEEFTKADKNISDAFIATFILFGFALVGSTYILSFLFTNPSSAQNSILFLNISAVLMIVASQLMSQIASVCREELQLRYFFRLLPSFDFGYNLVQLAFLTNLPIIDASCDLQNGVKKSPSDYLPYNALDGKATGISLWFLGIEGLVYAVLVFLIEYVLSQPELRLYFQFDPKKPIAPIEEDEDVLAEAERVKKQMASPEGVTDVVVLNGLRKVYSTGKVAVRDLSYGIPVGEVFGFLGINGAGKTTTLQMLSGDVLPSQGTAKLAGQDIIKEQLKVRRLLGYCPQFDAILDLVSVREHLELYARIKGVPEPEVKKVVEEKLVEMDLKPFEHKLAGRLSGGNKRKLGVAIALIGNPPIVFLDEPSTGMDPVARRFMWSVISKVATQNKSCSIILTTHSMEEVEALCTRIGIMVGGRLRCLGTSQHLKSRHGSGYQVEMKLSTPLPSLIQSIMDTIKAHVNADTISRKQLVEIGTLLNNAARIKDIKEDGVGWFVFAILQRSNNQVSIHDFATWWAGEELYQDLCNYMASTFTSCALAERQGFTLRFKVNSPGEPLSSLFAKLEQTRLRFSVASYTLGQTSLEMVFNNFAAQQEEEKGVARGVVVAGH